MRQHFAFFNFLAITLILFGNATALGLSVASTQNQLATNRKTEAEQFYRKGSQLLENGNTKAALQEFQQALKAFRDIRNLMGEATTLNNIGLIYTKQEIPNYQEALKYYQQSLTIFRQAGGTRRGQSVVHYNIGLCYRILQIYPKALSSFQQSLMLSQQSRDRVGEFQALRQLGLVYGFMKEESKSENFFKRADGIRQKLTEQDFAIANDPRLPIRGAW